MIAYATVARYVSLFFWKAFKISIVKHQNQIENLHTASIHTCHLFKHYVKSAKRALDEKRCKQPRINGFFRHHFCKRTVASDAEVYGYIGNVQWQILTVNKSKAMVVELFPRFPFEDPFSILLWHFSVKKIPENHQKSKLKNRPRSTPNKYSVEVKTVLLSLNKYSVEGKMPMLLLFALLFYAISHVF